MMKSLLFIVLALLFYNGYSNNDTLRNFNTYVYANDFSHFDVVTQVSDSIFLFSDENGTIYHFNIKENKIKMIYESNDFVDVI